MSNMQKINEALDGVAAIGRYADTELSGPDLAHFKNSLAEVMEAYDLLGHEATGDALATGYVSPCCTVILHTDEGDGFLRLNCAATNTVAIKKAVQAHIQNHYEGQDVDGDVYVTHVLVGHPVRMDETAQNVLLEGIVCRSN